MSTTTNLSEWVESFSADLYSWAYHKVSDPDLAKDLVQETYLAAAQKLSSFKGESSPKTWLMAILNYKIIDHYRKKGNQPVSMDAGSFSSFFTESGEWRPEKRPKEWEGEDEEHLLDNQEFRTVLMECLEALPGKWNACIRAKYLFNKKGDDICQELDIAATNLWQIIHRAKLQLRDCVEQNWFAN